MWFKVGNFFPLVLIVADFFAANHFVNNGPAHIDFSPLGQEITEARLHYLQGSIQLILAPLVHQHSSSSGAGNLG